MGVLDPDGAATLLDDAVVFDRESHVEYFRSCLKVLPHYYVGLDTTRLSAVYFCTLGLDLLGAELEGSERERVIDFVYSNQLDADHSQSESRPEYCGFVGSSYCGHSFGSCCRLAERVIVHFTSRAFLYYVFTPFLHDRCFSKIGGRFFGFMCC